MTRWFSHKNQRDLSNMRVSPRTMGETQRDSAMNILFLYF